MRFGVQHSVGDPAWTTEILAPDAVAEFARVAETRGFDLIAFTDHPAPSAAWVEGGGEGVADPFSALGFCAAVTSRVRLLTFVLVAAYRNPFLAAHQVATLDALSGGRLTVGLGTGYLFGEFRALGADPAARRQEFDERVALMRRAWSGETISVETPDFVARATRVLPRGPAASPAVVDSRQQPLWAEACGAVRRGMARHDDARQRGDRAHDAHDAIARHSRAPPEDRRGAHGGDGGRT